MAITIQLDENITKGRMNNVFVPATEEILRQQNQEHLHVFGAFRTRINTEGTGIRSKVELEKVRKTSYNKKMKKTE